MATTASKQFEASVLEAFKAEEFIRIQAGSQPHAPLSVWAVVVNEQVYARSFSRSAHSWYDTLRAEPVATVSVGNHTFQARALPENDPQINQQINEAYAAKYAKEPDYIPMMVADKAVAATVRVAPMA